MKRADLEVGDFYAVDGYIGGGTRRHFWVHASRVQLMSMSSPGAYVRVRNDEGHLYAISLRKLTHTWEDYTAERDALKAQQDHSKDFMQADAATIKAILGDKTPYFARGDVYGDGSYSTKGTVSVHELRTLIEHAYNAGRKQAVEAGGEQ